MEINIFAIIQSAWKAFVASSFFLFIKSFGIFAFFILLIADVLLLSKRMRDDWKIVFYGAPVPIMNKSEYTKRWEKIMSYLATGDLSQAKIAVIEADLMLGETLDKIGYKGLDTGDRIAVIRPGQLIGLDEVKISHEEYKKIVRDGGHKIGLTEIQSALAGYEKVLRGLELLD